MIEGITYRYLTRFFGDAPACGGHSWNKQDLFEVLDERQIGPDEYAKVIKVENDEKLMSVLQLPELCSDIRIVVPQ